MIYSGEREGGGGDRGGRRFFNLYVITKKKVTRFGLFFFSPSNKGRKKRGHREKHVVLHPKAGRGLAHLQDTTRVLGDDVDGEGSLGSVGRRLRRGRGEDHEARLRRSVSLRV